METIRTHCEFCNKVKNHDIIRYGKKKVVMLIINILIFLICISSLFTLNLYLIIGAMIFMAVSNYLIKTYDKRNGNLTCKCRKCGNMTTLYYRLK